MQQFTLTKFAAFFTLILVFVQACGTAYDPPENNGDDPNAPVATAPESQSIIVGESLDITFSVTVDAGYESASISVENGNASISSEPETDATGGDVVVTYTSNTAGAASIELTITDTNGLTANATVVINVGEPIEQNEPVAADGILETVTWNIQWYGDGDGQNGPSDENQQTENIIRVTDSLKADLYAFQEIYDQQALNNITENMSEYRGFVADHISWVQKTAFVYNTNSIDSVSVGAITEGQSEYAWANGRYPLYFEFTYTYENASMDFYAIVIHAKAFDDEESYQRRKSAAQDLYDYLTANKPDANIIFLGDYNDDVDVSIYEDNGDPAETPYQPFVENDNHFQVVSKALSDEGKSSTVSYPDMIDHITMSNELYSFYVDQSATVFQFENDFISNYGSTTSDHYPVWAKFDITTSTKELMTR